MKNIFTVTELNHMVKNLLEETLDAIRVEGEVSGLKIAYSGHAYFTLKDNNCSVKCVMFRSRMPATSLSDGMQIVAKASVSLYEQRGDYQLLITGYEPLGVGDLLKKFHLLKEKLTQEGLFLEHHKKQLPKFPLKVGVITSSSGAAVHDIIKVFSKRAPFVELYLYPALVQGTSAPTSLIQAIKQCQKEKQVDVIIFGRGGGSIEDLAAFNDEQVVRTLFASEIPVICAVGHETDVSLSDFVADERAPTPSAAAMRLSEHWYQFQQQVEHYERRFSKDILQKINNASQTLDMAQEKFTRFVHFIQHTQKILSDRLEKISYLQTQRLKILQMKLNNQSDTLHFLSPLLTLKRGYALALQNGKIIKTVNQLKIGDEINIQLHEGAFSSVVKQIE